MQSSRVNLYKSHNSKLIMIKRVFLLTLISLLFISFISAEIETLGTFKQNSCVNLLQTCSNCTYNNISSVTYPDSTQALGQSVMEKIGNNYNRTFCSTSQIGTYIVNGYGDVDGSITVWSYDFKVTPSGNENNPNFYYLIFIISIISLNPVSSHTKI